MSDEAKKALEQFLIALLDGLKNGATWAKEQVPLVLQEKLAFDFAWSAVLFVSAALVAYASYRFVRWVLSDGETLIEHPELVMMMAPFAYVFLTGGAALKSMLQIYFAPRLYLLEWAMDLVKK